MGFDEAFAYMMAWEREGWAHNPTEKFKTYSGISEQAYPDWPGWKILAENPHADVSDLVKKFYSGIWDKVNAARSGVDQDYFDTCILQGPRLALRLLVRMHNLFSPETLNIDAPLDLVMFKLDGLNLKVEHSRREGVYRAIRQAHLISLVEANPKFEIYLWGWIKRARGDTP